MSSSDSSPSAEEWDSLIFDSYTHAQIATAIADPSWQNLRISLLGMPSQYKYTELKKFVTEIDFINEPKIHSTEEWSWRRKLRKICVTNYVNALRRGGLIP